MNKHPWLALASLLAALLAAAATLAGDADQRHELKIMVVTDGDTPIDADVSDLAIGESRSFVTDSGKTVDVLRTADGIELYIDGELQDMGFGDGAVHGEHVVVHKDVNVECISDTEDDCEAHEYMFVEADGDYSYSTSDDVEVVEKRVKVICGEDDDCEEMVWTSKDGEMLHEAGAGHKVIRIHKKTVESD